jgi:ParB family chromosome partitioning protein
MKPADESRVQLIPVDRIRVVNPRVRDKAKFERIVESIAKLGLKKPITVTVGKPGDGGAESYDLVCGQGRLEAFKALGQTEIPALVRGLSKTDGLLASLIENIARRRVRSLDQIQMIHWMKEQGHGHADIARKTGLGEDYVKDILNMLRNGEERLLEAVLHGKIPVTIAVGISGATDDEAQRLLMDAYERKEMNQKSLTAFKRVLDQRRYFGRKYGPPSPRVRPTHQRRKPRAGLSPRIPASEAHGPKSQALRSEIVSHVDCDQDARRRRGLHQSAPRREIGDHAKILG